MGTIIPCRSFSSAIFSFSYRDFHRNGLVCSIRFPRYIDILTDYVRNVNRFLEKVWKKFFKIGLMVGKFCDIFISIRQGERTV